MLRRLAGQTAIYGVGTIVPRFLNYLLFPYLTRLMTTGEYGVVTDLYALIPFALVVLSMGLETGYFRFAGEATDPAQRKNIFANVWGIVSLAGILFFVCATVHTASGRGHAVYRAPLLYPVGCGYCPVEYGYGDSLCPIASGAAGQTVYGVETVVGGGESGADLFLLLIPADIGPERSLQRMV